MGLIHKQAGFDLSTKIEKWCNEYFGFLFEYTIDDDYQIKPKDDHDSWTVIFKLASEEIEIPDYVSFSFEKRIVISVWKVNIEKIVDTLNKYSGLFHNLEYIGMINHGSYSSQEAIEIVKNGNKFRRI